MGKKAAGIMQELEVVKIKKVLTPLEHFELILFQKRIKGQKICKDQLPGLRRLWPMVLTEIRQEAEAKKRRPWWGRLKGWLYGQKI